MKIEILYNSSCGFWKETHADIQDILKKYRIEAALDVVEVKTEEEAKAKRFFGSPHVNVNGSDVDPLAVKMTNFHVSGCRMYVYNSKVYDGPPSEMLERSIINASGHQ